MSIEETANNEFHDTEASINGTAGVSEANGVSSLDLSSTEMFPPLSSGVTGTRGHQVQLISFSCLSFSPSHTR